MSRGESVMPGESASALEGPLGPALFRVIGGSPTPEELAAIAVLLSARASARDTADDRAPAARWEAGEVIPPASWAARH
ncbi:acyl-CoA carboxylase subunit epsilon [Streptomyces sp. SP17BM10]|uniref:acyl-CoA carboxylase subunit epsilon n=1 Tax=Streptomyces sp. SP17BM10 TaxID=3002530 RepID=UPI002E767E55|nr:acyl-CoA carboxylase subunit epsilon [Streptomyces sp. SP17BM10]MEE1785656.1 acyl-CoA carboxylase subunit epsilon [Streptomyces sp. SP17BM10]